MKREDRYDRRLPAQRAFVVQLAATAEVASGRLEGRVEHVVSGQATPFAALEDLLTFMALGLRQGCPADYGIPHTEQERHTRLHQARMIARKRTDAPISTAPRPTSTPAVWSACRDKEPERARARPWEPQRETTAMDQQAHAGDLGKEAGQAQAVTDQRGGPT